MKKEFTFIWGQRFCLIVNYKCVCVGGGGGGVDTSNCRFAAAVIILKWNYLSLISLLFSFTIYALPINNFLQPPNPNM